MADAKLTSLTDLPSPLVTDIVYGVSDPAGTPAQKKIALGNLPVSTPVATALSGKATSTHTHAESDVTSLTTDLAGKQASSTKLTAIAALADAAGALTNDGAGNFSYAAAGGGGGGGVAGSNYFKVKLGTSANATGSVVVRFDTVITDATSVFDTTNHYWTCPTTGIYYFTTNIRFSPYSSFAFFYFSNPATGSARQVFTANDSYSTTYAVNGSATFALTAGDQIGIRVDNGGSINFDYGNGQTTLEGFRIA